MIFDFSTLKSELSRFDALIQKSGQQFLKVYGNDPSWYSIFFNKEHKNAWQDHQLGMMNMYHALSAATNVDEFNESFGKNFSYQLLFDSNGQNRQQESMVLNEVETFLRELRFKVNGKEDLFVQVMHCLLQRFRALNQDYFIDKISKQHKETCAAKCDVLNQLMNKIGFIGQQSNINSMLYYGVIVLWENQYRAKHKLSICRFTLKTTTSVAMLETIKSDLLQQAELNGDITSEIRMDIVQASKIGCGAELWKLSNLLPNLIDMISSLEQAYEQDNITISSY